MSDKRTINLKKQLEKIRSASDAPIIWVKDREHDWKCTECGFELSMSRRPGYCPDCNCTDGDTESETRLFIRKGAYWNSREST